MNYQNTESQFDYNILNLDTSDFQKYIDKINLYDLQFMSSIILEQLKDKKTDELFILKFKKILNDINKSDFNDLSTLFIKIGAVYDNYIKYNCYFYNYESDKPTENFYTYKKLLIFISAKIIEKKKNLKSKNHKENLLEIINKYLKYRKKNEGGNYILYNCLLNNIIINFRIDTYCLTAIDFCIENNIDNIEKLYNYNFINDTINKNIKTINGNYYYDSTSTSKYETVNILESFSKEKPEIITNDSLNQQPKYLIY